MRMMERKVRQQRNDGAESARSEGTMVMAGGGNEERRDSKVREPRTMGRIGGEQMKSDWLKKYGFMIAVAVVLAVVAAYVVYQYVQSEDRFPNSPTPAPDFALENLDGEQVTLAGTNGKVRLMYFFFSHCPDVCPPTTQILSKVQQHLKDKGVFGTDTMLMSVTFDPARDTVERLREYAGKFEADFSGWQFLRGEESYVRGVAKEYGVEVIPVEDGNFIHQNLYVLLDKEGNIRHYYFVGNQLESVDPAKIADDMIYLARK